MINKLKEIIISKQKSNDNSCGTPIICLIEIINVSYPELVVMLKILHKDKLIVFKKGINHDLVFLKTHEKQNKSHRI